MSESTGSGRRRFLLRAAAVAGAAPFATQLLTRPARAADLPPVPADNATAVALGYTEEASSAKHASFKPGSRCGNCQFYTAAADGPRGSCKVLSGFSVNAKGWCSAWAEKA